MRFKRIQTHKDRDLTVPVLERNEEALYDKLDGATWGLLERYTEGVPGWFFHDVRSLTPNAYFTYEGQQLLYGGDTVQVYHRITFEEIANVEIYDFASFSGRPLPLLQEWFDHSYPVRLKRKNEVSSNRK